MSRLVNTVMIDDAPIDVYGTICKAEPGIPYDYVDIDDLQIGGVSVYTLFSQNDLLIKVEEAVNDRLGA